MTVQALRERRVDTLAALLDAYGREIQGVAYLILRDRALAEDVTIETLLTAFEQGGSIRDEAAERRVDGAQHPRAGALAGRVGPPGAGPVYALALRRHRTEIRLG